LKPKAPLVNSGCEPKTVSSLARPAGDFDTNAAPLWSERVRFFEISPRMDVVIMCNPAGCRHRHRPSCLCALPVLLFSPKISLFHEKNPLFCLAGDLAGNPLEFTPKLDAKTALYSPKRQDSL
jgi:hypothetical protein